jgi:ATP adenylyltransferase
VQHKKPCLFCELDGRAILGETKHLFAIEDRYPVTPKHCLIIPKRHCSDFFELEDFEYEELFSFLKTQADRIRQEDPKVEAFNIGMNCGEAAGQTIFHCHVHLIQRRWGDIKDPKGGVRAVIADKKQYLIHPI